MKSAGGGLIIAAFLALGIGAGIGLARWLDAGPKVAPALRPPESIVNLQETFATVAEHVRRSVVHITTKYETFGNPYGTLPSGENTGIGSGVIVDARAGCILTNNHVIREAREIFVMLHDGRVYRAGILGADPVTDLAVVKLATLPKEGLVEAVLGDSDRVRVGDFVLAVGSPFGLHHTVTAGIISAKGRRAKLDRVQDFLQTDAKIFPGNSGGPLVSLTGHVIGINSAMITGTEEGDPSRRKEGQGVGLAIPSNIARWVYEQIVRFGRVRRGYLGIQVGAINDATAARTGFQSLGQMIKELGLKDVRGCIVTTVFKDTPAKEAGIVTGDVITRMNGKDIEDDSDLILKMSVTEPGATIMLTVVRGKSEREIEVQIAEHPESRLRPR
jgi:S1-C subfamily serine protease